MAIEEIVSPADLTLDRYPPDPRSQLRAWDAADEYLLRHLSEAGIPLANRRVAVIGDRWGALTTSLAHATAVSGAGAPAELTQISESYLAQRATTANLAANGCAPASARLLTTVDQVPDRVDVLLIRVPKSLALLEDLLHRLAPALTAEAVIIGTGMVTEIHTSTLQLFEQVIGPTKTSLAVRKARLIFATRDPKLAASANPWPHTYRLPDGIGPLSGRPVVNHAGVFSADHLDIGTRFFLDHLPTGPAAAQIIDLACGNGVLGVAAALQNPSADLTFLDESYPALASARATFAANLPAGRQASFLAADGLADTPSASADLVLNNPPFHSHQATTDATAWRMFTGARRVLRPGGELWVVGNRHLGYHVKLKRVFGNCETVAGNPKFVVLRATRR